MKEKFEELLSVLELKHGIQFTDISEDRGISSVGVFILGEGEDENVVSYHPNSLLPSGISAMVGIVLANVSEQLGFYAMGDAESFPLNVECTEFELNPEIVIELKKKSSLLSSIKQIKDHAKGIR